MERLSIDEVIEHCRRTCENTEMMTIAQGKTQDDITSKNYWEHYQVEKWLKELKAYQDSEEQGLLLRLPIAEGTQVFCIGSCGELCDDYETDCESCGEHLVVFCTNFDRNMIEQFGETVFATEEEAEQKLASMQKGE